MPAKQRKIMDDKIWCPKCQDWKLKECFYFNKNNKPRVYCIACERNRNRSRSQSERERVFAKQRSNMLKQNYGINSTTYNKMFEEQNGLCFICNKPQIDGKTYLYVDHCHKTGVVRGLLCALCNTMLGMLERDGQNLIDDVQNYVTNAQNIGNKWQEIAQLEEDVFSDLSNKIEAWGEMKTPREWSEDSRCVVGYTTLTSRLSGYKWDPETAISSPKAYGPKHKLVYEDKTTNRMQKVITAWGETKTLEEWFQDVRVTIRHSLVENRLYKGWNSEEAFSKPERIRYKAS